MPSQEPTSDSFKSGESRIAVNVTCAIYLTFNLKLIANGRVENSHVPDFLVEPIQFSLIANSRVKVHKNYTSSTLLHPKLLFTTSRLS